MIVCQFNWKMIYIQIILLFSQLTTFAM
uniref:Uncharacterized protein n=1 Tax=Rhizophora mucronata TaxID=61149 RepID=A0A2P2J0A7_RHIMU